MQDANVQHIIADLRSVDLPDSAGPAAPVAANRLGTRGGSFTLVPAPAGPSSPRHHRAAVRAGQTACSTSPP